IRYRYKNSNTIWTSLYLMHKGLDLIEVLALWGWPRAPLHALDSAKLAVIIGPHIPNADLVLLQPRNIRLTAQKPQLLADNTVKINFLGGQQRKRFAQVITQLMPKE